MHAPKRSLAFYSGPWNFTVVIEVFGFCTVKYEILTVAPKRPVVFIQQNTNFWILCSNGHSFYGNSFFDYEIRNTKMDIPFWPRNAKFQVSLKQPFVFLTKNNENRTWQETLRVVMITMICSILALSGKFRYFQRPT